MVRLIYRRLERLASTSPHDLQVQIAILAYRTLTGYGATTRTLSAVRT